MALHNLGLLPSNGFISNALMYGSAAEMLLLSLALADRINSLQRLQDRAQQEALKVNREMVDALRENERQLESRVTARTAELEQANDELTRNKALLEEQANHDALTGLANRKLLKDRLLGAQVRSQRNQKSFALLVIDLDRFKQVNDRFGHIAGDEVLIQVSRRLQTHLREGDTVARIGGDEFVVILESVRSRDTIRILQGHLLADVARPILLGEQQEVSIGMSIGMAIYPEDTTDIESLFHIADQLMYAVKQTDAAGAG
jgi:diguanylate cyclase (GGDEF)-like protein